MMAKPIQSEFSLAALVHSVREWWEFVFLQRELKSQTQNLAVVSTDDNCAGTYFDNLDRLAQLSFTDYCRVVTEISIADEFKACQPLFSAIMMQEILKNAVSHADKDPVNALSVAWGVAFYVVDDQALVEACPKLFCVAAETYDALAQRFPKEFTECTFNIEMEFGNGDANAGRDIRCRREAITRQLMDPMEREVSVSPIVPSQSAPQLRRDQVRP